MPAAAEAMMGKKTNHRQSRVVIAMPHTTTTTKVPAIHTLAHCPQEKARTQKIFVHRRESHDIGHDLPPDCCTAFR
jgi:hypothetical protein